MTFEVDDNIPVPPTFNLSPMQGVVNNLEVGQSFFYPTDKRRSAVVLALKCATRAHIRCVTRTWEEDGVKGIRVWRVE